MNTVTGLELVDPARYAEQGPPHELFAELRKESPVAWFEPPGYEGFWAITRHADIRAVSTRPDVFVNSQRLSLEPLGGPGNAGVRAILTMDPPEHRVYRQIASRWFTPRNLRAVEDRMVDSARRLVDKMASFGPETTFDFVTEIAVHHPLRLIAHLLGVPEEDEPEILRLTNEVFGAEDKEFESEGGRDAALGRALATFTAIMEERQRDPRDDLASVIANADIDGEPIGPLEILSYYVMLLTAGHETTRSALSGGMLALVEHGCELARLQAEPGLVGTATEEIVRWVTPINHFARTAIADHDVGGVTIKAGQSVGLFYASGNRDEDIFDDPFAFRIDRDPNPHIGFGHGEHFCLGANLARFEIRTFLTELATRISSVEVVGQPDRLASTLTNGLKHLPIRCRMAD